MPTLQTRVANILTRPASEWQVIAAERTDVESLYANYVLVLAAIPAVCAFLALASVYGLSGGLVAGCLSYVSALVTTFVGAVIIEQLAPSFESDGDTTQALKLVAYASTPVWLAGVLRLVPLLEGLIVLAVLYAVYLFYVGVRPVMKTPQDRVVPFMIVSALVVIVVRIVLDAVFSAVSGAALRGGAM
jgi:hypothetical protein